MCTHLVNKRFCKVKIKIVIYIDNLTLQNYLIAVQRIRLLEKIMKVYLIRASEWRADVNCVCATKGIVDRERKRLGKEYDLADDEVRRIY